MLDWILQVNLLGGDIQLASLINGPKNLEKVSLSPAPQREESNMLTFFLPYAVTMLFYIIILSAASLLLSSVTKEKENRVMEILIIISHSEAITHREDRRIGSTWVAPNHRLGWHRADIVSQEWNNF